MLVYAAVVLAQGVNQGTNSFFDDSETRTYALNKITVDGEIDAPGVVEMSSLPLRSISVKEVALESGKPAFKGAFYYSGYSLYDILNGKTVRKARENSFSPFTDLYVIVENDRAEKAVFSWGEIYYAKDNFGIILSKSVQGINPSKLSTKWTLPAEPRLVCGNDFLNVRFISNPSKITVRSFLGTFATAMPADVYSPDFRIAAGAQTATVSEIGPGIERRKYANVGYGHGTGFKAVQDIEGYLLKDVLQARVKLTADDARQAILVLSAKDGYRAVASVSEVTNRGDLRDFLLLDRKNSREDGRYVLFSAADFFVDRNVKAIERFEIVRIK
jgi:hypothetical protein